MIEIDVNGPRVALYDDKGKRVDGHIRTTKEKIGFLIDKELIVRMGKVSESARAPHTLLCCIRKGNVVLTLCKFEIEWVSNIQAEAFASGSCFLYSCHAAQRPLLVRISKPLWVVTGSLASQPRSSATEVSMHVQVKISKIFLVTPDPARGRRGWAGPSGGRGGGSCIC